MAKVAFIDIETRSACNLKKTGSDVYFGHPSTGLWCLCYAFDNEDEIHTWQPGEPISHWLSSHIAQNGIVVAHNATFELLGWKALLEPAGWPELRPEQMECTMARAAALALPQDLWTLSIALRLPTAKDKEGHALMLRMCRPRRIEDDGTIVWWTDADKLARLIAYCKTDVQAEREAYRRLHPLSQRERALWQLDFKINRRGIKIDIPNVHRANELVKTANKEANADVSALTDGAITTTKQASALLAWLRVAGIELDDLRKRTVADVLKGDNAKGIAREVLQLRQLAGKASTAKLAAMLRAVNADYRARGLLRFHAASTGRWAGARIQPQNLPRSVFISPDCASYVIRQLPNGKDMVELYGGPVQEAISSCLRAMLVAADGHDFIGADYSNIEGRVCAWLADEKWKLDAFRAFDAKTGPDLYLVGASRILGIPIKSVDKKQRQAFGKVPELALQYNGALGAFTSMALNYDITVIPDGEDDLANYVLTESTVKGIVKAWRAAHPRIVEAWKELFDAACNAVRKPDTDFHALNRKITYRKSGPYLWCILPNGKTINYVRPRVEKAEGDDAWKGWQLVYEGVDSFTKRWGRQTAYGGLLMENITQAVARECLAEGLENVEAKGYPVVLHVHDDIVAEVSEGFGSEAEFSALMLKMKPWARGLPLAVEAWREKRYGLK